jgi:hypothetical protein
MTDRDLFLEHTIDYFGPHAERTGEIESQLPIFIQWDFIFRPSQDPKLKQLEAEAFRPVQQWFRNLGLPVVRLSENIWQDMNDIPDEAKVPDEVTNVLLERFQRLDDQQKGACFTLYCCGSDRTHWAASQALVEGGITPKEFAQVLVSAEITPDKLSGYMSKTDWKEAVYEFEQLAYDALEFSDEENPS